MRTPHKPRAQNPATAGGGFTLIEIMMVVGILGMVLAMGMPAFIQSTRKDPLRQAVKDIEDACSKAREAAIMRGVPAELVISADGHLTVSEVPDQRAQSGDAGATQPGSTSESAVPAAPFFSAQWQADLVQVRLLYVNLKAQDEATESRVHFFPNGTSDEFTIILQFGNEVRKISLEVVTALVNVESNPNKFRR